MDYFDMNEVQKAHIDGALSQVGSWVHDGFEEAVIVDCIGGAGEGLAHICCPWDDDKAPEGEGDNPLLWHASLWLSDWDSGEMGGIVYNGTYAQCIAALQRLCGGLNRIYSEEGERTYPVPARDIVIGEWWSGADFPEPKTKLVAEQ